MSSVANIVLNDAQATPVAHTFIPQGTDSDGRWWYEDQSPTNPIGYNRISLQLVKASVPTAGRQNGSRVNRVKITLHTPVMETIGTADNGIVPPPTIAYIPRVSLEFVMDERTVLQGRKDLTKFTKELMTNSQVTGMVEALQNVY